MTPRRAFQLLMAGDAEKVPLDKMANRVVAVGVIPYPPGIPIVMPGENVGAADGPWITYLRTLQEYGHRFPGFAKEVEGTEERDGTYHIYCLKKIGGIVTGTLEGAPIQARDLAMGEFALAAPSIPIPFHRLLKVVALVDRENAQTRQLLDRIAEEKFEIEVSERYDRDVSEDADVGAYIISIDGDRREPARNLGRAVRAIGFRTPIWALADSHRVADVAVLAATGEVDGYIYLGQQTPAFYAKQVIASLVNYGMSLLPPVLRRARRLRRRGQRHLRLPRPPGRAVLPQLPGRSALLQAFRRADLPQRPLQRRRGPGRPADSRGRRGAGAAARRPRLRRRQDLLRPERHQHLQQGGHQRGAAARRSRPVRPQQPQVPAPGRAGPGRRDSDLPPDGAQPVRHDRRGRLGRLGRGRAPGADPDQSPGHRIPSGTRRSGPSGSPASSSRPTTARSTTSARCWRRSGTCATTCSGTRPGSATTRSIRCSRTTARCA